MKHRLRLLCMLAVLGALCASMLVPVSARDESNIVFVPMRDGVRLSTLISRPVKNERVPTILLRTPYGHGTELIPNLQFFVSQGYAVAMQDVRGRYGSSGKFQPLDQERNDGYDTIAWIASQPWSNGRVGMMGGSYLGYVQWQAALTGSPHLRAIFPTVAGSDEYLDRFYSPGGAMKLGHRLLWMSENVRVPMYKREFTAFVRHLPLRNADVAATGHQVEFYQRLLRHPTYDEYWRGLSVRRQAKRITVPAFILGGWFDNYVQGDLEMFRELSRFSAANRLVVGPWPHRALESLPGMDFGKNSGAPIRRFQLEWFDQWLKDAPPPPNASPVRIFVMGANIWRDEREWPIARTRYVPMYLAGAPANSAKGQGLLLSEPDRTIGRNEFTYDPRNPVPTIGGSVCCNSIVFPWGPLEQREAEARNDVLVYTSPPMRQPLEVTGTIRVNLLVSTSAPDTDFTAKLVVVYPNGRTRNLTDGILRLRYRESLEKPVLSKPGEVYQITIDCGVTSYQFQTGERIRVDISSSNFPRFDRNPNTGAVIADETQFRTARQTVLHGRFYPSHILLPTIPAARR
ncbi:MAG TPA: CocE/NonD family hydrolase [Bryobacteraceae bacterium]|nr:CocE/NonD family hydrolase [Bryobacteraceae bacterium]